MASPRLKKILSTALKMIISAVAIWYLIWSLTPEQERDIFQALEKAHWGWLILAFLLFNISKIISSIRLNKYFQCISLKLSEAFNLKLYYLGMFYNLFLPGGIGGDGYKVYYLNRNYDTPVKKLISATILDRLSGAVVLGFLALILAMIAGMDQILSGQNWILALLALASFPIFWVVHNRFFKDFNPEFFRALIMGFGVQLSQLVCAAFILMAINARGGYFDYMTLFLVSSVVAVLPFTIGGIGAREFVMLEGVVFFASLNGQVATAMAFSILFFLITAVSSLLGSYFSVKLK